MIKLCVVLKVVWGKKSVSLEEMGPLVVEAGGEYSLLVGVVVELSVVLTEL